MSDPVDALVLDLLEWIGGKPRPYAEVIEAWRTSCPRLPVWEEANARGFVSQQHHEGAGSLVSVSPSGREWLAQHRALQADGSNDARHRNAREGSSVLSPSQSRAGQRGR